MDINKLKTILYINIPIFKDYHLNDLLDLMFNFNRSLFTLLSALSAILQIVGKKGFPYKLLYVVCHKDSHRNSKIINDLCICWLREAPEACTL